jgi:hypothetical protein
LQFAVCTSKVCKLQTGTSKLSQLLVVCCSLLSALLCCAVLCFAAQVWTWPSANTQHGSLLSSPTSLTAAGNTLLGRGESLLMGMMGVGDIIAK